MGQAQILANRCNTLAKVGDLKGIENRFKNYDAIEELNIELDLGTRNHLQQANKLKNKKLFLCPPEIFGETRNNYRTVLALRTH